MTRTKLPFMLALTGLLGACAEPPPPQAPCPEPLPVSATQPSRAEPPSLDDRAAIDALLDGWHAAATRADEDGYFHAMTDDFVFLGTDATERWDKAAFRAYAHPHFAKGKAWSFRSIRRDVLQQGDFAWFDEDLATPNLGPARGSGVVVRHDGNWRIAHYVLSITVPNDRFGEVKRLLREKPAQTPKEPPEAPSDGL
ncbi:MAG: nuclear transport factor 2 family protein [Polyangiaceae bacterium]